MERSPCQRLSDFGGELGRGREPQRQLSAESDVPYEGRDDAPVRGRVARHDHPLVRHARLQVRSGVSQRSDDCRGATVGNFGQRIAKGKPFGLVGEELTAQEAHIVAILSCYVRPQFEDVAHGPHFGHLHHATLLFALELSASLAVPRHCALSPVKAPRPR